MGLIWKMAARYYQWGKDKTRWFGTQLRNLVQRRLSAACALE